MKRGLLLPALAAVLVPRLVAAQGVADAEVLPQWAGGLLIQPALGYGPGTLQRFGRGWQVSRESLVTDFNGLNLTEVIAGSGEDAQNIESLLGSLGTTSFEGQQNSFAINFMLAFGLTERLTLVAVLPYQNVKYTLDASLIHDPVDPTDPNDRGPSTYRVKDPEALDCPGGDFDLADDFNDIVEDVGEPYEFNIADLNRALISKCLGYKPVIDRTIRRDGEIHGLGDRRYAGFRDFILGAKYQFFRGRDLNLAALAYVVAPTGKQDDPDDLFDVRLGDGQWDAALLAAVTWPIGRFRLGASFGYEISFGDTFETRLSGLSFSDELEDQLAKGEISEQQLIENHLDDGQVIPVVTRFDKVSIQRKLGDTIYLYTQFGYQLNEWLSIGATLNWLHHFRDRVDSIGPRPMPADPYKSEEAIRAEVQELIDDVDNTITEEDRISELKARLPESDARKRASYAWRTVRGNLVGGIGLNFNFLPMFLRGEFPIPLIANVSVSRFLAGQNLDTPDALNLTIVVPFIVGDVRDPSEYGYDDELGGGPPWF